MGRLAEVVQELKGLTEHPPLPPPPLREDLSALTERFGKLHEQAEAGLASLTQQVAGLKELCVRMGVLREALVEATKVPVA